jgi:hypothetical protein
LCLESGYHNVHLDAEDEDHNLIPGSWRQNANLQPLDGRHQGVRELEVAKIQRQTLVAYFNSPAGAVPWQEERIRACMQVHLPDEQNDVPADEEMETEQASQVEQQVV